MSDQPTLVTARFGVRESRNYVEQMATSTGCPLVTKVPVGDNTAWAMVATDGNSEHMQNVWTVEVWSPGGPDYETVRDNVCLVGDVSITEDARKHYHDFHAR